MPNQNEKGAVIFNYDREQVDAALKSSGKDRLVVNETVGGKAFKILEVTRKVGPLSLDDTNNNLC
ncbi:hypothetical protein [Tsuneonella sp. SYSU-LHT278]|uniref:hypothetical protein n=1 Tax=Tsuneonella sediminis TaxID=3416089 RepID=UPI003F78D3D9